MEELIKQLKQIELPNFIYSIAIEPGGIRIHIKREYMPNGIMESFSSDGWKHYRIKIDEIEYWAHEPIDDEADTRPIVEV